MGTAETVHYNSTEKRLLELLCNGCSAEMAAQTVGVAPSLVSTFLAQQHVIEHVQNARTSTLLDATKRDRRIDRLEEVILGRLEQTLPMMYDPAKLLGAFKIINGATRRGQTAVNPTNHTGTVVQLVLPNAVINQYMVDSSNRVVQVGDQTLETMRSGDVKALVASIKQ